MVTRERREVVTESKRVEWWEECDRCGKKIESGLDFDCSEGSYSVDYSYGVELDLCVSCREVFWKILKENGFEPVKFSR